MKRNRSAARRCRGCEAEIHVVRPRVVALGATAAQALLGPSFRLTKHRGEFLTSDVAPSVIATVQPSSIFLRVAFFRPARIAGQLSLLAEVRLGS